MAKRLAVVAGLLLPAALLSSRALAAPRQGEGTPPAPPPRLRGFTVKSGADQRATETKFLALPQASECRQFLRVLTEDPHPAGSEASRALAEYVRARFLQFGFEAEPVTYEVLLSTAKKIEVTLVEPEKYE